MVLKSTLWLNLCS